MVQGTSSSAGKSVLVTALARSFARRGLRVAPFKAQNMSNNARVVAGGEIGTAQWLQARAARVEPDVRMNPVLVKPEGDGRSQVVVLGRVDHELSRSAWRGRSLTTWPVIADALRSLMDGFDMVVIEGAGSPAETNLWDCDVANMRVAEAADARVLLVADIDRGGAFAHLFGTWALLPEDQRRRIGGFVLNKFRGDVSLLEPALADLTDRTGVPVVGVVPWLNHALPDEEGARCSPVSSGRPTVAIVRYPTASNLDEFKLLEQAADVRWAVAPRDLDGADLIVLPGSKHVAADLRWLRERFEGELRRCVEADRPLLAICGGLQMLGRAIEDPHRVDGAARGLGLIPVDTVFEHEKIVRTHAGTFAALPEPWRKLSGVSFRGYEIRHGRTTPSGPVHEALADGGAFVSGSILAIYAHGLFENESVVAALFGRTWDIGLDETIDRLADAVEDALDMSVVWGLSGLRR
jgi:adenosylcobyric acid synthase